MSEAAFPVYANNRTFGFSGLSSTFIKIFSAQRDMAWMVFDFPTPKILVINIL